MQSSISSDMDDKRLRPIKTGFFETWRLVRQSYTNPLQHARDLQDRYGDAVMQRMFGMTYVHLFGPEAHRLALVNQDQVFSNKKAWDLIIGRIFTNGLMLRDGADHRYHRRIMQAGFKSQALQRYMQEMVPQVQCAVADLSPSGESTLLVYPVFKALTLDLAATIFLGMDLGADARKISKAFELTVAASMPRIPFAIPGTILWKGIRARNYMCAYFLRRFLKSARETVRICSPCCAGLKTRRATPTPIRKLSTICCF